MSHAIHHLAVWQRAVFLLNSRRGSFTAPGIEFRDPFFRSYGASVPSSLTRFLSRALVFSYLSTCVGFGTDAGSIPRSFSRRPDTEGISWAFPLWISGRLGLVQGGFASPAASTLRRESNYPLAPAFRWLHWSNSHRQLGNVDPMSIDYAFRPCLRIRLTPGGRTCPGKPWNFGVGDSHPDFRYSCPHNHFLKVHRRFRSGFAPAGTLPYHPPREAENSRRRHRAYSRSFSARGHSTSQLLRNV